MNSESKNKKSNKIKIIILLAFLIISGYFIINGLYIEIQRKIVDNKSHNLQQELTEVSNKIQYKSSQKK